MHFEIEHDFAASAARVAAVLCDPEFHTHLDLPDMSRPVVIEHSDDGVMQLLRLRYEYTGRLDPIAKKVIGGRKLTWIQELELETETLAGTLSFAAEAEPKRLFGSAAVTIVATDGDHAHRRIAGDLHVKVPLVGNKAEKSIVPGLVRRLDVEATALAEELKSRA